MRHGFVVPFVAVMVVAMMLITSVPTAFCYSSDVNSICTVSSEFHSIHIYDKDQKVFDDTISNDTTIYSKSGTSFTYVSGDVSSGLYLGIEGSGSYTVSVSVSGASTYLSSVSVNVGGTAYSISLSNGSGSSSASQTWSVAANTYASLIVKLGDITSSSSTLSDLTLGEITFSAVSVSFTGKTSVLVDENAVTVSLSRAIEESQDVVDAISDENGGTQIESDSIDTKTDYYYIRKTDDINGHPAAIISYDSNENGSTNLAETADYNISFSMNLPANMLVCFKAVIDEGWSNNEVTLTIKDGDDVLGGATCKPSRLSSGTYFVYYTSADTIGSEKQSNAPDLNSWIKTGPNGLTVEITGSKNNVSAFKLELRVLMENAS